MPTRNSSAQIVSTAVTTPQSGIRRHRTVSPAKIGDFGSCSDRAYTKRVNVTCRPLLSLVSICLLMAVSACGDDVSGCVTNAECAENELCINGECAESESADGGGEDAAGADASVDAGPEADSGGEPDAGPPVCGAECDTSNPCEAGAFDCESGEPVCVAVGPAAAGTSCRELEGECDVAETCDGVSLECPANERVPADTECRAAVDTCDAAETCDGTSPACPLDGFAATGTSCPEGFCDGSGVCSDSCTPGATCDPGVLCRAGRVDCSGGTPSCELDGNDGEGTMCGATENGSWSTCSFEDTCAQSGTQTRPVTSYACGTGTCRASVSMESRSCSRSTDGAGCGSPSNGSWSSCGGFDDTCDQTGTRSRTVSTPTCGGGSCNVVMTTQTEACSRSTNGTACGSVSNGPWAACGYSNSCDESASRSRTVTTPTCSSGSCGNVSTTQTEACSRDTDGVSCGATITGDYGTCRTSGGCSQSGTRSRTVTDRECVTGTCSDVASIETVGCSVNTNGNPCPGPPCGLNRCSGGSCNNAPNCPSGQLCCGVGDTCASICP